jgi:mono/diheme cytochrome c family protein
MRQLAALALLAAVPTTALAMPGVPNPGQARVDYMLKCQGCHQPDGAGNAVNTPPLAGVVARFLAVPGGRQFVARVPGVAMVDLDDVRLAQLLNWTLHRFDASHVPAGFTPYTPAEIAALRRQPLRLDRAAARAALMARMSASSAQTGLQRMGR